eukprot:g4218.t1
MATSIMVPAPVYAPIMFKSTADAVPWSDNSRFKPGYRATKATPFGPLISNFCIGLGYNKLRLRLRRSHAILAFKTRAMA